MLIKEFFNQFSSQISVYPKEEAKAISFLVFEEIFKINKTNILANNLEASEELFQQSEKIIKRLNTSEPVQHIIGHTYFLNLKIRVNKDVLIPRPETEELVQLIIDQHKGKKDLQMLDLCTGSGCIPIGLAKNIDGRVSATDVSKKALALAKKNAKQNQVSIEFIESDLLEEEIPFSNLDIIVSNPPYIPESEKSGMDKNVKDFDPHLALFVPDKDPLLFYRSIAEKAYPALKRNGKIYLECHKDFASDVLKLFQNRKYRNPEMRIDIFGNPRFVVAEKI
jgi:release factor glutamine methyltransferase